MKHGKWCPLRGFDALPVYQLAALFYVPTGQVTYRMTYNQSPLSVFAVVSITLSGVFLLTFCSIIAVTG